MSNSIIREYAKSKGVFLWQIAERVGVNDGNFSRKLRNEFSKEDAQKILSIIDDIAAEEELKKNG